MAQDNAGEESQLLQGNGSNADPEDDTGDLLAGDLGEDGLGLDPDEGEAQTLGFNTDLAEMDDEALEQLGTTPEGRQLIRNQARPQSQHTHEWQRLRQQEADLAEQRRSLDQQQQAVLEMLTKGQPQGAVTQSQATDLVAKLQGATSTEEMLQRTADFAANQASGNVTEQLKPLQDMLQQIQLNQYTTQVDAEFDVLARSFPQLKKEAVRARITKYMRDNGIPSPRAAYGAMILPAIEKKQQQALQGKAETRKGKPATKSTKATARTDTAPKTLQEAKAAAMAAARQDPDSYIPDDVKEMMEARRAAGEDTEGFAELQGMIDKAEAG